MSNSVWLGWLRDRPRGLEQVYQATEKIFRWIDPLINRIGYRQMDPLVGLAEGIAKGWIFDCRMCGQCILHFMGMTCPMTCPKHIRNGPCGGVDKNGDCEVIPTMRCVWIEAYDRSKKMKAYRNNMVLIQPPLNYQLHGRSAWVNMLCCADDELPPAWKDPLDGREPDER